MAADELPQRLQKLHQNLNILQERRAKYGVDAPLSLLNQIDDHQQAIRFVEQTINGQLSEEDLAEQLAPLNLSLDGGRVVQNIFQTIQTLPRPFLIGALGIGAAMVGVLLFGALLNVPFLQVALSPTEISTPTPTITPTTTPSPTITPTPSPTPFTSIAQPDEKLILVSRFNSQVGQETYQIGQHIYNELADKIFEADLSDVKLALIPQELTPEITDQAQALGQQYHSTLVIWGLVDSSGINARFSVINPVSDDLVGLSPLKKLRDPLYLTEFNAFIIDELPNQIGFLTAFAIGQIYLHQHNHHEAERILELLLADFPETISPETLASVRFYLGLTAYKLNNLQKALAQYDLAIGLAPQLYEAHYNRGLVHQDLLLFPEAVADFSEAIALKPTLADAYVNRGVTFLVQNQMPDALADFNAALEQEPTSAAALLNRAIVYKRAGALEQALADYDQVINLLPDFSPAYEGRARVYQTLGNYEQAIADFEKALELDPQDKYQLRLKMLVSLGWTYYLAGDYQTAIEINQDSLKSYANLQPGGEGFYETLLIRYNLALALLASGQPELAAAEYEQALRLTEDPQLVNLVIKDIEDLLAQHPNIANAAEIMEKLRAGKF
ncbi:MAG: tetratricopeptide repeat protein [Anaerolineae bacterium]|nr:tetratricopeptide repeat protein [Anaerolineae bacterium]